MYMTWLGRNHFRLSREMLREAGRRRRGDQAIASESMEGQSTDGIFSDRLDTGVARRVSSLQSLLRPHAERVLPGTDQPTSGGSERWSESTPLSIPEDGDMHSTESSRQRQSRRSSRTAKTRRQYSA